jgi:hypothetical protein
MDFLFELKLRAFGRFQEWVNPFLGLKSTVCPFYSNGGAKMNFQKGYELQRLVAELRIRGMFEDADRLEKDCRTNYLTNEAAQIVREEARDETNNR